MGIKDRANDLELAPKLSYWGQRVIGVVLLFCLVFTMVNVQQFAAHDEPGSWWWWTIAWLLDPMATLTAGTAIVFEVFLSDHGRPRIYWLTATKWYALIGTWAMNIWSSVAVKDPAGILLHSVAPGITFLIAEAAPRVWEQIAAVIADAKADELTQVAPAPTQPAPQLARSLPSAPVPPPVVAAPSFPSVTRTTPAPTAVTPRPTQMVKQLPKPAGDDPFPEVTEELVARARQLKAARAAMTPKQRCGWAVLAEEFGLKQLPAKELARRMNSPVELEVAS